ncbi:glycoside hydrolase family 43 protein [Paracnuella aquatica]|uniref:glycoside hydrolase family 43 protein n=1 Tax=Paracnuella aquatica TaxID=2268757 RepID=UPI000DEF2D82|nr:glycoside hydrolase family 43 protein [Paracnuella aquatica]RPD44191.1 beta-xylosidase [Paracnuella aquatica]
MRLIVLPIPQMVVRRLCAAAIVALCSLPIFAAAQGDTLQLADPALFFHKGTYYLYGTVEGRTSEGFLVYTSTDQKAWQRSTHTPDGFALRRGDAFGDKGFWAPQVFAHRDSFYMAYVANEQIAIATSTHPAGPFRQVQPAALQAPVKQIDPFIFMDDDGKKYLYHVRLDSGNKIFVAEMRDDFSGIKEATVKECIRAVEPWENTANAPWPVAEGPSVIKRNGVYYLFYTANDFRNPDYAVGYAVATSPYGPWQRFSGNPVLTRQTVGYNGTGHGDFIPSGRNQWLYVFHTHHSAARPTPRKTALIGVTFDRKTGAFKMEPHSFRFLTAGGDKAL